LRIVREIVVWGSIASMIYLILTKLLITVMPESYNFWIYDSLVSLVIAMMLLAVSKTKLVSQPRIGFLLRYLFSNFMILTIYNFVFALKIISGRVRFCVLEYVNTEEFYQHTFASNFIVFLSTFLFMLIFKSRNIVMFSKASVTYILIVLVMTLIFRIHYYFQIALDWIF